MAQNFMPIKPLLMTTIEAALNAYLALDDQHPALLAPLAGKVVAIHITPFDQTLYLCMSTERIQCLEHFPGQADASLTGSLAALGLMGLSATPMRVLLKGDVRIAGDTQVARRLQRLFEKLEINWQGQLARYTGERVARNIADIFSGGRNWTQRGLRNFRLNLQEFLQEETRNLPARPEAEIVFRQIDELRLDQDRLAARVQRLFQSLTTPSAAPATDEES